MVSSLDNWDGSLSNTVNEQPSRITNLLNNNTDGTSTSANKITDERINTLGIREGWQDMVISLDMNRPYDASILNQPLSRDSPMLPISGPSLSPMRTTTVSFSPISSSLLHTRMPPARQLPIVSDLVPSRDHSPTLADPLELISTHTADGDGDDEDVVEIEDVTDTLSYPASTTSPTYHEQLSLFTPPPEDDILFSPQKQSQARPFIVQHCSRRLIMSHIEIPPLKRPRSDYRPFPRIHSTIVSKRRVAPNQHLSIQEALQASIQHNSSFGILPLEPLKKRKKRREDAEAIVVARPSSIYHPTGHFGPDQAVRPKKRIKRSFIDDDDDDWGAPPRSRKRPRIVVDLTITDDEHSLLPPATASSAKVTQYPRPKAKSTPKTMSSISKSLRKPPPVKASTFVHAAYNSETDTVTLCLEDIRPLPLEILTLNTRFLRQSLGNDIKGVGAYGPRGCKSTNINCSRQNGLTSCFLSVNAEPSSINDVEEISVGGLIFEFAEEEMQKEVIEISSDSSLKENVPQKKNVPSLSTLQVSSFKIQHRKITQEVHVKPKQRRRLTGGDVNRSSISNAPLDVFSLPPPRPIPSSTKGNPSTQHPKTQYPKTQYPKTQYPKKKGREPQHGSVTGQPLESGSDYPSGAMPSAKALGKRRAASPMSVTQLPSHHSSTSPHHYLNSDFDPFINYHPTAISPAMQSHANGAGLISSSSLSGSYDPLDTLASIFHQASSQSAIHMGTDMNGSTSTHSHTLLYNSQPESRGDSFFSSADSLYDDVGFPGDQHVHQQDQHVHQQDQEPREQQYNTTIEHPWSASLVTSDPDDQYAYQTIDPTLLGGEALSGEADSESDLAVETGADLDGGVDGSDSDWNPDHESDDDKPITIRKPIPVSLKKPITRSVSPIEQETTGSRARQTWPLDEVDAYCHQCRRKTFYAKMTCSDCQKKFCVRCYAFRYPECEFDANDEEYSCPACEGFCNCTVCCRKRGEPYIGVRTCDPVPNSPQPRPQRPRVERVKLAAKTNLPPPTAIPTTTMPKGVTQSWGSVYSVTGEKIGACFYDPSTEKNNSVVFAPVTTPIMTSITEVVQQMATATAASTSSEPKIQVKTQKLKRRVFIGEPQPCWGYKNPKIRLLKREPCSKRSYTSMPRFYIGKRECLFYPIEEDDSSLTPMDESDEVQEVDGSDVEEKSFSPDSLGDGDVSRAILLGLHACGVVAVEVPAI